MSTQVTWLGIVGALVPSLIALIAAVVGLLNRSALKTSGARSIGEIADDVSAQLVTGNDKTVGEMVTEVHGEASTQATAFDTHAPGKP